MITIAMVLGFVVFGFTGGICFFTWLENGGSSLLLTMFGCFSIVLALGLFVAPVNNLGLGKWETAVNTKDTGIATNVVLASIECGEPHIEYQRRNVDKWFSVQEDKRIILFVACGE